MTDALAAFEDAPLTRRYWLAFGLLGLQLVLELFDFFVIGFIMAAIAPGWGLTVLQTTVLLLSTGLGAIVGAMTLGRAGDRIGRRPVMGVGGVLCAVACMATALVPDGGWIAFAILRFFVGVGYGAAGVAQFSLVVELTPSRLRTLLASALSILPAVGLVVASTLASRLFPIIGWRGLAVAGGVPVVFTLLAIVFVPESFRWQIGRGQTAAARSGIARLMRRPEASLAEPAAPDQRVHASESFGALFAVPRRMTLIVLTYGAAAAAASGVYLWGPLIGTQVLKLDAGAAAGWFVLIGVSGLVGRIAMTVCASRFGRRVTGAMAGILAGVLLAATGLMSDAIVLGFPAIMLCLVAAAFFFDGTFANLAPYAGELYPVAMGARALSLAQAASGAGKLLGPALLGLLAGSGNLVTPTLVVSVVPMGMAVLGALAGIGGLAMAILGEETHGRALALRPTA